MGIPVRNGAASLEIALRSILNQTHRNLEIVISDNASSDATADICKRFAREDSRIRYFRQPATLRADDNFRFVFDQCSSDWFFWASHDDLRDDNYVEVLLAGFAANPGAALTFTETQLFSDYSRSTQGTRWKSVLYPTRGVPFPKIHTAVVANGEVQFYGLFRSEVLRTFRWPRIPEGHDWLVLHWAISFGDFVYVPGSTFRRYFTPKRPDPAEFRAYHWLKGKTWLDYLDYLPDVRWALHASRELTYARRSQGLETRPRDLLPGLFFLHHGGAKAWAQQFVYWNAPPASRQVWRALKNRSQA